MKTLIAALAVTLAFVPQDVFAQKKKAMSQREMVDVVLAAAMAALLAVADQVIDTWTDGHLLAGWVALWTLAFAALAILASPLRLLAANAAALISRHVHRAQLRRSEARMWEYASCDPRTLADLRLIRTRTTDGF